MLRDQVTNLPIVNESSIEPTTALSRRVYRRRRLFAAAFSVVVLVCGTFLLGTQLSIPPAAIARVAAAPPTPGSTANVTWPDYGSGALGAVGFAGLLSTHGDQGPVPIASITKIVTALVVLRAKPLSAGQAGPSITFTSADVGYYNDQVAQDGSVAPVIAGSSLSEVQTLQAMLLPSANNYATSLAVWAYGSVPAYLSAAQAWLNRHNLVHTSVADTSGISPKSMSSPSDLVTLGELALANPVLASIVDQPAADLPGIGTVKNTNQLLGTAHVDGIKTGTTDQAGACLLFASTLTIGGKPIVVVGALLNGATHPQLDADITAVLSSVPTGFHQVQLASAGDTFGTYTTAWGESVNLVTKSDVSAVVWSDTPTTVSVTAKPSSMGVIGDTVGSASFTSGDTVTSVPLILGSSFSDPGPWWRASHPIEMFGW